MEHVAVADDVALALRAHQRLLLRFSFGTDVDEVLPVHAQVFDPNRDLDPFDEAVDWKGLQDCPRMDDPEGLRDWRREDADRRDALEKGNASVAGDDVNAPLAQGERP